MASILKRDDIHWESEARTPCSSSRGAVQTERDIKEVHEERDSKQAGGKHGVFCCEGELFYCAMMAAGFGCMYGVKEGICKSFLFLYCFSTYFYSFTPLVCTLGLS